MGNILNPVASGTGANSLINLSFKLLFFVVVIFYVFYAFLLTLRVRILSDTLNLPNNRLASSLTYFHLIIVLVGSFLALVVLLLA